MFYIYRRCILYVHVMLNCRCANGSAMRHVSSVQKYAPTRVPIVHVHVSAGNRAMCNRVSINATRSYLAGIHVLDSAVKYVRVSYSRILWIGALVFKLCTILSPMFAYLVIVALRSGFDYDILDGHFWKKLISHFSNVAKVEQKIFFSLFELRSMSTSPSLYYVLAKTLVMSWHPVLSVIYLCRDFINCYTVICITITRVFWVELPPGSI